MKQKLLLLSIIDTGFVSLVYLFITYMYKEIKLIFNSVQDFGSQLQGLTNIMQGDMSQADITLLTNNLDLINQTLSKIVFLGVLSIIGLFLFYSVVQSIQWSIVMDNFKKYWVYLIKFLSVSFGYFIFLIFSCYFLLVKLRNFILNFWFGDFFKPSVFLFMIILIVLLIIVSYIMLLCYVYLGKFSITQASKLVLSHFYKRYKLFLIFLGVIIFNSVFVVFILRLGFVSPVFNIMGLFVVSLIFNWYRIYLVKEIK